MIPQVPNSLDRVLPPPPFDPVFTIDNNHLLEGAELLFIPGGSFMPTRRLLVVHFTNGTSARNTIDYWRRQGDGVCAHLTIDRDGTVFQSRAFNRTAGHAGESRWRDPKTRALYTHVNNCSIGIELCNAGADPVALAWAARQPGFAGTFKARHRNGGAEHEWEMFSERQLVALIAASRALVKRYHLDDITGHDCIAPERRDDPGPAFPMQRLREACGFEGLPTVFAK